MHLPGNAGHAFAVVAHRSQNPRNQSAVASAVFVARVVRPIEGVGPVAAAVQIHPHVGRQVFMGVTHTGVQYCHDNVAGGGQHIPGFGRVNVGVRCAAVLARVVQTPQGAVQKPGVVGRGKYASREIGLRKLDQATALVFR